MSGQGEHGEQVHTARQVSVGVGGTFDVVVDDLPGAGYRWVVRELPEGLSVVDDSSAAASSERVGGSTRRSIRVRADAPGRYELILDLLRSWESHDVPPARTQALTVEARDTRP